MKKTILLSTIFAFFLSGCFDLKEKFIINPNGSGMVEIHYELSLQLAMKRFGRKAANPDAAPLTEEEFLEQLSGRKRLDVRKIHMEEAGDMRIIDAEIGFRDISDLNQRNFTYSITDAENGGKKLELTIKERASVLDNAPNQKKMQAEPVKEMLEAKLGPLGLVFSFELPGPINSAGGGAFEPVVEGNKVTVSIPLSHYLVSKDKEVYTIIYGGEEGLWQKFKNFLFGPKGD